MSSDEILMEAEEKMIKTEQAVVNEFAAVRTGKAFDFINPYETSLNREVVKYFLDPAIKKELDVKIGRAHV